MDFNYGRSAVGAIEEHLGFHAELARESRMKPILAHVMLPVHNTIKLEHQCEGHFLLIAIIVIECLLECFTIIATRIILIW